MILTKGVFSFSNPETISFFTHSKRASNILISKPEKGEHTDTDWKGTDYI